MKLRPILFLGVLAGLAWPCIAADDEAAEAAAPVAPSAEVLAALKAQPIGGKLVGNTVMVSGDKFVAADLAKAPDYYIIYYTASW